MDLESVGGGSLFLLIQVDAASRRGLTQALEHMPTIVIDGYLVQAKPEQALSQIVSEECWKGREVRLPTGRRRWDMSYKVDDVVTVVEFDGDEHYRNTLKIKADEETDTIALKNSFRVVRVPYWVQLTSETVKHYFGLEADIQQYFPHGFITTKIFPASFCPLGLRRFERELVALPVSVRSAVVESLRSRIAEYGKRYVVPEQLEHVLQPVDSAVKAFGVP